MSDPFDLDRFVQAQAAIIDQVLRELGAGRKQSHWMWFVFPQIAGLGHSPMAQHYAIRSLDEARAFLDHERLGPRLVDCTRLVNQASARSAHAIFGSPDDLKFHSSMTLFALARPAQAEFQQALAQFFDGLNDRGTLAAIPP